HFTSVVPDLGSIRNLADLYDKVVIAHYQREIEATQGLPDGALSGGPLTAGHVKGLEGLSLFVGLELAVKHKRERRRTGVDADVLTLDPGELDENSLLEPEGNLVSLDGLSPSWAGRFSRTDYRRFSF